MKGRWTLLLFNYEFMQRAFLAMIAMASFAPVLGIFLILRRQSLMSDTLSHVSLAGVAFGLLLGWHTSVSTIVVVLLAAVFLEYLRTVYRHFMEIGTAILMATGLAVAMIVMSKSGGVSNMSLDQYLFGSILTIRSDQVWALFAIAAVTLVFASLFLRVMYLVTFNEDTALVDGLPVRLISIVFNCLTGVAIALMIPAAGALLLSTIMVLPAAIALRIGKTFKTVILFGVLISFVGMLSGLYGSYYAETPASATITLIFVIIFLVVNLLQKITR